MASLFDYFLNAPINKRVTPLLNTFRTFRAAGERLLGILQLRSTKCVRDPNLRLLSLDLIAFFSSSELDNLAAQMESLLRSGLANGFCDTVVDHMARIYVAVIDRWLDLLCILHKYTAYNSVTRIFIFCVESTTQDLVQSPKSLDDVWRKIALFKRVLHCVDLELFQWASDCFDDCELKQFLSDMDSIVYDLQLGIDVAART